LGIWILNLEFVWDLEFVIWSLSVAHFNARKY